MLRDENLCPNFIGISITDHWSLCSNCSQMRRQPRAQQYATWIIMLTLPSSFSASVSFFPVATARDSLTAHTQLHYQGTQNCHPNLRFGPCACSVSTMLLCGNVPLSPVTKNCPSVCERLHRVQGGPKLAHFVGFKTSSNFDQFSNFFHCPNREKMVIVLSLKIPPHLKCVATLPCEMSVSIARHQLLCLKLRWYGYDRYMIEW